MRINPQRQYPIQIIKCHTSRRKQKQKPTPVLARNQPANQIKKDKGHLQSEKVKLHHQFKSFFASLPQKLQFSIPGFGYYPLHINHLKNRCPLLLFMLWRT